MKIIILAGGWGSRLGHLSESVPKPMINIGNKPILWHIMKIYSFYGYNDFVVALGVKANVIKDYFYNYENLSSDLTIDFKNDETIIHQKNKEDQIDWKVTLVDTGINTLKGGRIKRVSKFLSDETNMLTYGDGLSNVDISKLLDFHKNHNKTVTITGVQPPARFGEINEKNGAVLSFEEKPQSSIGLINGGFMIFNNNMLEYLSDDEDCDFEFGVLEHLSKQGEVMVYKHPGEWECMDNERDVLHLNKVWNDNSAFWKKW